ncbi:hypothetical protein BGZ93_000253, partial [Podila epicladia]
MGDSRSSGWYIYAILVVTATIAVVFFGRVCHAKRKERIRAEKDRACEVPEQAYILPSQDPPPAPAATATVPTLPTITVVSDTPPHSFEPPAYED